MTECEDGSLGAVRYTAPAKINLFLHVVGRRTDGYHLLESLFAFSKSGDRLEVCKAATLSLVIEGPFAQELVDAGGGGAKNLVFQAAELLRESYGYAGGASIRLTKNLPVASGIGGGSADAAAALLALNQLWQLDLSFVQLEAIAIHLGADVPACLYQHPLKVRGIGEQLEPTVLPSPISILLVNPRVHVSTPQVFGSLALMPGSAGCSRPMEQWGNVCGEEFWRWLSEATRNDLGAAAARLNPVIGEVLEVLEGQQGVKLARMSGSGATCFALFEKYSDAQNAAKGVAQLRPDWWCFADELVSG